MSISKNKRILIPLPTYGFDPTEAAIPWKLLSERGFDIVFATPNEIVAEADKLMVSGARLGIWKGLLKARKDAVTAYHEMIQCESFLKPLKYDELKIENFDGVILPGGHDKGVKEFLESTVLQKLMVAFFVANKPIGAICHGVVLLSKSINPETSKSVLYDYKTTALLESQELLAYTMTRLWMKDYYLTYPELKVEQEVKSALKDQSNFLKGNLPIGRDSLKNMKAGFCVKDRNYVSARWPGDVYNFSLAFEKMFAQIYN